MLWPQQRRQKPPRGLVANLLYTLIGEEKREGFQDQDQGSTVLSTLSDFYKLYDFISTYLPNDEIPSTVNKVKGYYETFLNTANRNSITTTITIPTSSWDTAYKFYRLIMFDPRTCNAAQTLPPVRFYLNSNLDTDVIDSNSFGSNDMIYKKVGVITIRLDKATRINGYTLVNKPSTDTWMLLGSNEESAFDDLGDDVEIYLSRLSTEQSNWTELDRYPKQVVGDVRESDNKVFKSYSLASMNMDYTEAAKILADKFISYIQEVFKLIKFDGDLKTCMQDFKQIKDKLFFKSTSVKSIQPSIEKTQCMISLTDKFKKQVYDSARTVMSFADSCKSNTKTTATLSIDTKTIQVVDGNTTHNLTWTDINETSPTNILKLNSLKDIYTKYKTYTTAYKVLVQQVATPAPKPSLKSTQDTAILPTITSSVFVLPEIQTSSYVSIVFHGFKRAVLNILADYYKNYREDNGFEVEYSMYYDPKYQEVFYKDKKLEDIAKEVADAQLSAPIFITSSESYAPILVRMRDIYQFYQTLLIGLISNKDLAKRKYGLVKMVDIFTYYFNYLTSKITSLTYTNIPSLYEREKLKQSVMQMNADEVQTNYTKYSRLLFYDENSASATISVNDIVGVAKKYLNQRIDYFKSLCTAQYKGKQLYSYYVDFDALNTSASNKIIDVYEKNIQNDLTTLSNVQLRETTSLSANDDTNALNKLQLDRLISLYKKYESVIQRIDNQTDGYSKKAISIIDIDVLRNEVRPIIVLYTSIYGSIYTNMIQTGVRDLIFYSDYNIDLTTFNLTTFDSTMKSTNNFDENSIRNPSKVRTDSPYTDLEYLDNLENFDVSDYVTAITDLKTTYYTALDKLNEFVKNRTYEIMKVCRIFELKYLPYKDYIYDTSIYESMTQTKETLVRLSSLRGFGTSTTPPADVLLMKSIKTGFSTSQGITAEFVKNSITQNQIDKIGIYINIIRESSSFINSFNQQLLISRTALTVIKAKYVSLYNELSNNTITSNKYVIDGVTSSFTLLSADYLTSLATTRSLIGITTQSVTYPTSSSLTKDTTPYSVKESDPEWTTYNIYLLAERRRQYGLSINYLLNLAIKAKKAFVTNYLGFYSKLNDCRTIWFKSPLIDQSTLNALAGYNNASINTIDGAKSYNGKDFQEITVMPDDIWKVDEDKPISEFNATYSSIVKENLLSSPESNMKISIEWKLSQIMKEVRNVVTTVLTFSNAFKNIKWPTGKITTSTATKSFAKNSCYKYFDTLDYLLVGGGGAGAANSLAAGGGGSGYFVSSKTGNTFSSLISEKVPIYPSTAKSISLGWLNDITVEIGSGGTAGKWGDSNAPGKDGNPTLLKIGTSVSQRAEGGKAGSGADGGAGGNGGGGGCNGCNSGGPCGTGGAGLSTDSKGGSGSRSSDAGEGGSQYGGTGGYAWNSWYCGGADYSSTANGDIDFSGGSGGGGIGGGTGGQAASGGKNTDRDATSGDKDWGAGGGGMCHDHGTSGAGGSGYAALIFSSSIPFPTSDILKSYNGSVAAFTNPPKSHTFKPATCVYQQPVARSYQNTQQADWAHVWSQQALQTRAMANQQPFQQLPQQLQQQLQQQQTWDRTCPKPRVVPQQDPQRQKPKNAPLFQQGASLDAAFGGSLLS